MGGVCGEPNKPVEDPDFDLTCPSGDFGIAHQAEGHKEVVLRESADGGKIVGMVPNGDRLKIIDRQGDSCKVTWKEKRGWVKKSNVKSATADAPHVAPPEEGGYQAFVTPAAGARDLPTPEVAPTPTPQVAATCVSCRRPTQGGHRHCCRTCENTKGQSHGTRCEQANAANPAAQAARGAPAAASGRCVNCQRSTSGGHRYCCRTCEHSQGRSHGPRCETANPAPVVANPTPVVNRTPVAPAEVTPDPRPSGS